jgi:protein-S-isoprenylcysteine O-methyltransferase Ste14
MYINNLYTWIFVLLFLGWALSELFGPVRWSKRREASEKANHDRRSLVLAMIVGVSSLVLSFLFPLFLSWSRLPWQLFWGGVMLVFLGITWRWYAIQTLGKLFTAQVIVQHNQEIVQHGPYQYMRHPAYTGFLLIIIGFGLMIGSWLSVLLFTLSLGATLLYRISVEEQALLQQCPTYKIYMQKTTKRLLPFLY